MLLAKTRRGGRPLTFTDAQVLAAAAYPSGIYPESVSQRYGIRRDLLVADPTTHFVFYADLS